MAGQTVKVSVLADTKNFKRSMAGLGNSQSGLQRLGNGFKRLGNMAKTGTKVIAGMAAATTLLALKGGFERALKIEDAEAKLKGLGYSTKAVQKVMDSALKAVQGTAFGMDEAATTAATAMAAGVKNGQDLTKYLTLVGDAATIAGTDMSEMGAVFNKVQANGRMMTDNLNQLQDRGLPVLSWLSEHYKVSTAEMSKMVSSGKVDSETFRKIMAKNIGGAAQESGNTTRGSFKNMQAALSRAGQKFLTGVFPLFKTGLQGLTGLLDKVGPFAEKAGAALSGWFTTKALPALQQFGNWITTVGVPALQQFGGWLQTNVVPVVQQLAELFITRVVPALQQFGQFIVTQVLPVLQSLGAWIVGTLVPIVARLVQTVASRLMPVFNALIPVLQKIWAKFSQWLPTIQKVITVVAKVIAAVVKFAAAILGTVLPPIIRFAGFLAGKLIDGIGTAINWVGKIIGWIGKFASKIGDGITAVSNFANRVGEKIGEAIQWFKDLPGKVKSAFSGAGQWLVESGKNVVQGLLNGIGSLASTIGNWFLDKVPSWIKTPFKKALGIHSPSKVFEGYGNNIIQGLVKGLHGSRDRAKTAITNIANKIKDTKGLAGKSGLVKWVEKQGKTLVAAIAKQEKNAERLKKAQEKLANIRAEKKALQDQIASSLAGELDLSSILAKDESGQIIKGGTTFKAVAGLVASMKAKARTFKTKMDALIKAGFPAAFVQMVAGYGLDAGIEIAGALLSGSATERQALIADYSAFNSYTNGAGKALAGQMYDAGIQAQKGIVKGLSKKDKKLEKAADTIADRITKQVKKKLGIKSPSRVFTVLGKYTVQGLAKGLEAVKPIDTAMRKVSTAVTGGYQGTLTTPTNRTAVGNTYQITVNAAAASPADVGREIVKAIKAHERVSGKAFA
ncbi:tape measure domain-containing protein [Micrococcales bacterium KH10]|nr:tape measure domain-containing protein [Micrococcales bacterium KH10]